MESRSSLILHSQQRSTKDAPGPLFAGAAGHRPDYGDPPSQVHSRTSREAGRLAKPGAASQRARVLDHIAACERHGATDHEIQHHLGLSGDTVRPRRIELVKAGQIAPAGTRRTASGRQAQVWVLHRYASGGEAARDG